MVWLWVIASVLGFLAVVPLTQLGTLELPLEPRLWLAATAVCLGIFGINWLIQYRVKKHRVKKRHLSCVNNPLRTGLPASRFHHQLSQNILSLLFASVAFFAVLMASISFGLYHYSDYQNRLITEPITITATIRSQQMSDNITLTANNAAFTSTPKTASNSASLGNTQHTNKNALIGTGYQRQAWQIVAITPFADEKSDNINSRQAGEHDTTKSDATKSDATESEMGEQNSSEDFSHRLPLNVLATANLNKNPEWLPILNNLQPNQTLTVKLALEPITSPSKVQSSDFKQISLGFDEALWLRQRDIQAKAQVIAIYPKAKPPVLPQVNLSIFEKFQLTAEQIRWQLRQKFLAFLQGNLSKYPASSEGSPPNNTQPTAILLSLLTGDSGLLSSETKHLYQVTGISHLLAISGPHVMMLASVVAFLLVMIVKRFFPSLLLRLPAQLLLLWVSVVVSFAYAMLVGFELPAQRTVWMLLLVTLSVQWLLPISTYRVLAWVGLVMLWLDTTAVLQAGFWLSFVAVGLLLKFSQHFSDSQGKNTEIHENAGGSLFLQNSLSNVIHGFKQLILLQLWLFMLMMPVVVWFFGKISLVSIGVNLVAVPFLGLVIVPLDMLAGVLSFVPIIGQTFSEMIWQTLASLLTIFHQFLQKLSDSGFAKQLYIGLSHTQLLLLGLGVVWALLPKRLIPKLFILPILLAVFAVGYQARQSLQHPQLIVLDDTRLTVSLWANSDNSWLILSDNRYSQDNADKKLPTADILENKVYPLLAKYKVDRLAGVISQTPSVQANGFIQQLAATIPVQNYWLAGVDPLQPNPIFSMDKITAKPCNVGQHAEQNNTTIEAITGWQLNDNQLDKPLSDKEKWQTQTCFIELKSTHKSAIIMAGDSDMPLQMSQLLCKITPINLLISPAVTPISQAWLKTTQPDSLHLISGRYSMPTEDSEFAIAGYIEDNHSQNQKKPIQQIQSDSVGTVAYEF